MCCFIFYKHNCFPWYYVGVQLSDSTAAKAKPISQAAMDQLNRSLPPSKDQ